jgi:hypothetical protein
MNANIFARIAGQNNITRIANNVDNIRIAREATIMNTAVNTVKSVLSRTVKTVGAAALLALAAATVKADVIVDTNSDGSYKFVGPQQVYNDANVAVNPGMTALQLKIHNTDPNYTVSSFVVSASIYLNGQVVATPKSAAVSLAPGQARWINVIIPDHGSNGKLLRGQTLTAVANVDGQTYTLSSFLDSSFNIGTSLQAVHPNNDGTVSVEIEFTNQGNIGSLSQSVSFTYVPYAEGFNNTYLGTLTAILPALQPGQSSSIWFKTANLRNVSFSALDGWFQIGTEEALGSEGSPAVSFD